MIDDFQTNSSRAKPFSLIEALTEFVSQIRFEDLPPEVIEAGKKCFVDWLGVALGGMKEPAVQILINLVQEVGGKEQASVLGYGMKADVLNAALINGTMAHVLDYDDAHGESRSHPSAPLIAALLAISEYKRLSGVELLTAHIAGYEVSTRIGLALGKGYYESGWHATSILGRFGSAAGVGKLLKLDRRQLARAIGLGATQAGGLRSVFGTMGKPFHVGKAAMDGMLSVLLASKGFEVPADILEGKINFLGLFHGGGDIHRLTQGLGQDYQILKNSFKPYAACLLIHPAIDGLICLKARHQVAWDSIEQIDLGVNPLCFAITNRTDPGNALERKFSLPFCAALAVLEGRAGESQFKEKKVHDGRVREIMSRIRAFPEGSLSETEANVVIKTRGGGQLNQRVVAPKGDRRNPLSFEEIVEKFQDITQELLTGAQRDQLLDAVKNLERIEDASKLIALCRVNQ